MIQMDDAMECSAHNAEVNLMHYDGLTIFHTV